VAGDLGASTSGQEAQLMYDLTKPDVKVIDAEKKSYYQTREISKKKKKFSLMLVCRNVDCTPAYSDLTSLRPFHSSLFILVKSYDIFLVCLTLPPTVLKLTFNPSCSLIHRKERNFNFYSCYYFVTVRVTTEKVARWKQHSLI
jgi:hypothetical protein